MAISVQQIESKHDESRERKIVALAVNGVFDGKIVKGWIEARDKIKYKVGIILI